MAICSSCGAINVDGVKVCQSCGCAVVNEANVNDGQRHQEYAGTVYKCPNCGEVLQSFVTYCPACGFELRGTKTANAAHELAAKLEAIGSKREYQRISLIRSFAIPNTKEDIYEFIILAASNIDGIDDLSKAWLAKSEQAYQKAKLVFGNSSDFQSVHNIFEEANEKMKEAKREARNKDRNFIIGFIGFFLFLLLIAAIGTYFEDQKPPPAGILETIFRSLK
jgi:hypothetical protein